MSKSTDLFKSMKKANVENVNPETPKKPSNDETIKEEPNETNSKTIKTFSFTDETVEKKAPVEKLLEVAVETDITPVDLALTETEVKAPETKTKSKASSKASNKTSSIEITPVSDNEPFTIKRTYQFKDSTIRKLNELKNVNPDVNIQLRTIIDQAINSYYDQVFKK
ncbi:MAG: hypothetical protein ACERKV_01185 [Clostridiaceae bacterium]